MIKKLSPSVTIYEKPKWMLTIDTAFCCYDVAFTERVFWMPFLTRYIEAICVQRAGEVVELKVTRSSGVCAFTIDALIRRTPSEVKKGIVSCKVIFDSYSCYHDDGNLKGFDLFIIMNTISIEVIIPQKASVGARV